MASKESPKPVPRLCLGSPVPENKKVLPRKDVCFEFRDRGNKSPDISNIKKLNSKGVQPKLNNSPVDKTVNKTSVSSIFAANSRNRISQLKSKSRPLLSENQRSSSLDDVKVRKLSHKNDGSYKDFKEKDAKIGLRGNNNRLEKQDDPSKRVINSPRTVQRLCMKNKSEILHSSTPEIPINISNNLKEENIEEKTENKESANQTPEPKQELVVRPKDPNRKMNNKVALSHEVGYPFFGGGIAQTIKNLTGLILPMNDTISKPHDCRTENPTNIQPQMQSAMKKDRTEYLNIQDSSTIPGGVNESIESDSLKFRSNDVLNDPTNIGPPSKCESKIPSRKVRTEGMNITIESLRETLQRIKNERINAKNVKNEVSSQHGNITKPVLETSFPYNEPATSTQNLDNSNPNTIKTSPVSSISNSIASKLGNYSFGGMASNFIDGILRSPSHSPVMDRSNVASRTNESRINESNRSRATKACLDSEIRTETKKEIPESFGCSKTTKNHSNTSINKNTRHMEDMDFSSLSLPTLKSTQKEIGKDTNPKICNAKDDIKIVIDPIETDRQQIRSISHNIPHMHLLGSNLSNLPCISIENLMESPRSGKLLRIQSDDFHDADGGPHSPRRLHSPPPPANLNTEEIEKDVDVRFNMKNKIKSSPSFPHKSQSRVSPKNMKSDVNDAYGKKSNKFIRTCEKLKNSTDNFKTNRISKLKSNDSNESKTKLAKSLTKTLLNYGKSNMEKGSIKQSLKNDQLRFRCSEKSAINNNKYSNLEEPEDIANIHFRRRSRQRNDIEDYFKDFDGVYCSREDMYNTSETDSTSSNPLSTSLDPEDLSTNKLRLNTENCAIEKLEEFCDTSPLISPREKVDAEITTNLFAKSSQNDENGNPKPEEIIAAINEFKKIFEPSFSLAAELDENGESLENYENDSIFKTGDRDKRITHLKHNTRGTDSLETIFEPDAVMYTENYTQDSIRPSTDETKFCLVGYQQEKDINNENSNREQYSNYVNNYSIDNKQKRLELNFDHFLIDKCSILPNPHKSTPIPSPTIIDTKESYDSLISSLNIINEHNILDSPSYSNMKCKHIGAKPDIVEEYCQNIEQNFGSNVDSLPLDCSERPIGIIEPSLELDKEKSPIENFIERLENLSPSSFVKENEMKRDNSFDPLENIFESSIIKESETLFNFDFNYDEEVDKKQIETKNEGNCLPSLKQECNENTNTFQKIENNSSIISSSNNETICQFENSIFQPLPSVNPDPLNATIIDGLQNITKPLIALDKNDSLSMESSVAATSSEAKNYEPIINQEVVPNLIQTPEKEEKQNYNAVINLENKSDTSYETILEEEQSQNDWVKNYEEKSPDNVFACKTRPKVKFDFSIISTAAISSSEESSPIILPEAVKPRFSAVELLAKTAPKRGNSKFSFSDLHKFSDIRRSEKSKPVSCIDLKATLESLISETSDDSLDLSNKNIKLDETHLNYENPFAKHNSEFEQEHNPFLTIFPDIENKQNISDLASGISIQEEIFVKENSIKSSNDEDDYDDDADVFYIEENECVSKCKGPFKIDVDEILTPDSEDNTNPFAHMGQEWTCPANRRKKKKKALTLG